MLCCFPATVSLGVADMLRAIFIVYAVASSALLDDATAADAETRAEHIVQLCAEHHRDAVAALHPDAYHIRHLPSLRGLVVEATQAEVAALKAGLDAVLGRLEIGDVLARAVAAAADRRARRFGRSAAAARAADAPQRGGLDVHQWGGGLLG